MNFLKIYVSLVRKAEKRKTPEGYCEKHHVFPQSIFGKNNRTVLFTAKEHFISHFLLWKICKQRYGSNHQRTKKMHLAFNQMTWINPEKHERHVSRSFVYARQAMSIHNTGENNPSKKLSSRKKISESKKGKERNDMKGKRYFGADEKRVFEGIEKMREKKTGMKINYPKNRKSPSCSEERAKNISDSRKKTKQKFEQMTEKEFLDWIETQKLFAKDGKRKNSNVTRVLMWRSIDVETFYEKRKS